MANSTFNPIPIYDSVMYDLAIDPDDHRHRHNEQMAVILSSYPSKLLPTYGVVIQGGDKFTAKVVTS